MPQGKRFTTMDSGYSWVVLFAAFMLNVHYAFSVAHFAIFLVEFMEYFDVKKSALMWIGALHMFCGFSLGNISGWLIRKYHCRLIGCTCAVLSFISFVISAFTPNIAVLYFSIGILASIGLSNTILIAMIATQMYFDKRRSLANGIVTSGVSAGLFIWPPVCRLLIDEYGWRGAMLILAALQLQIAVYAALIRPIHIQPETDKSSTLYLSNTQQASTTKGELAEEISTANRRNAFSRCCLSLWKPMIRHPQFAVFCCGLALMQAGFLTFIIMSPMRAYKMGISKRLSSLIIPIMATVSGVLRIVLGFLGDRRWANRFFMIGVAGVAAGTVTVISFSFTSFVHMALYASFIGIPSATFMSLMMPSIRDIVGLHLLPVATGTNAILISFGHLFTLLLSGWILDLTGEPKFPFLVFGVVQASGGICILALWQARKRSNRKLSTKAGIVADHRQPQNNREDGLLPNDDPPVTAPSLES